MFNRLHTYTVHVHPDKPDEPILVREGAAIGAFIFGGFWLLYHRVWLWGALAVLLAGVCEWLNRSTTGDTMYIEAAQFVLALFIALEARELFRESLARRGYVCEGIVSEASEERALLRFYEQATRSA